MKKINIYIMIRYNLFINNILFIFYLLFINNNNSLILLKEYYKYVYIDVRFINIDYLSIFF